MSRADLISQRRRVERNARALAPRVAAWIKRRAKLELDQALTALRTGKLKLKKSAADDLDAELVELLTKFGVRQTGAAGSSLVIGYGGEWVVSPSLVDKIMRTKRIRVTRLSRNIRDRVVEEIRRIAREANREEPRPSVGEVARRMRERFSPTADDPIWALDPARAALIARTESQQNEQTGLFRAARDIGVEGKEWLASGNPNHGDRHHELMDKQQKLINEPFVNPTTLEELMYPGDPAADISETASCGCGWRALRIKDMDKRSMAVR